jgi:hypothetical protein
MTQVIAFQDLIIATMKRTATTDLTKRIVVSMRVLLVTSGQCTSEHLNVPKNSAIENKNERCYTSQHHHTSIYIRSNCNFSVNISDQAAGAVP